VAAAASAHACLKHGSVFDPEMGNFHRKSKFDSVRIVPKTMMGSAEEEI
jgi:hypothetical protein